ncbi:MAG: hypothetical protein IPH05_18935 [Flavobacteriales bacterium]|nr:hypothetical protein [Flavobacteriales bacterium]
MQWDPAEGRVRIPPFTNPGEPWYKCEHPDRYDLSSIPQEREHRDIKFHSAWAIQFANRQFIGPAITGCLMCASLFVDAQGLEGIGKKNAFLGFRGLSAYTGFYSTDLNDPRLTPWTWGLSARLNLSIYDPRIPFSMTFSEKQRTSDNLSTSTAKPALQMVQSTSRLLKHELFPELTMSGQRFFGAGGN